MKVCHYDQSKNIAQVWFTIATAMVDYGWVLFLFEEERKKEKRVLS